MRDQICRQDLLVRESLKDIIPVILAVMKKGKFLYAGNMKELLAQAKGHVWICKVKDETAARALEKKYHVSSKQYAGDEVQMKLISEAPPQIECRSDRKSVV